MARKSLQQPAQWIIERPAGDPVCRDPPARGHYMNFICRGFLLRIGAAEERTELDRKRL